MRVSMRRCLVSVVAPSTRALRGLRCLSAGLAAAVAVIAAGCAGPSSPAATATPTPTTVTAPAPTGPLAKVGPALSRYTNRTFRFTFDVATALLRPNDAFLTTTSEGRPVSFLYLCTCGPWEDLGNLQVVARAGAPPTGAVTGDASVLSQLLAKAESAEEKDASNNPRLVAGKVTKVDNRSAVFICYRLGHKSGIPNRELYGYEFYGPADTYWVALLVRNADAKKYYPAFLTAVRSFRSL